MEDDGGELETEVSVPTLASLLLATATELRQAADDGPAPSRKATAANPTPLPTPLPLPPTTLLNDPVAAAYLSSLLDQPLQAIQSLPAALAHLSTSLDNDLASLAFARYPAFLLSHKASQAINHDFSTLSSELAALLESTEQLERAASHFEARVQDVRLKRDRMARVRERMEEVEELLEAPSVVDACVRAGYWSEAIDVAARLAELHARLSLSTRDDGPDDGRGALALLDGVRDDVSLALLSLRARVLESLLQRGLKLPAAVRGIGILRRMNGGGLGIATSALAPGELHEEALRIVFLAARWRCLRAELETVEGQLAACGIKIPQTDNAPVANGEAKTANALDNEDQTVGVEENEERTRWIRRWIEVWREVVGETVGMYSEIFLSPTSIPAPPSPVEHHVFLPDTAPLSLFLSTALAALSATLSSALPALTSPASLSALLTQLSYCSHAFVRHGLEFREVTQLRERIEHRVGSIVLAQLVAAGRSWEREWRAGWESSVKRRGRQRSPFEVWLVVPEGLASVLALPHPVTAAATEPFDPHPSPALALLPPLARLLNSHARALNSLRLLPARSLYSILADAQARELDRAAQVLVAFVDALLSADPPHDDPVERTLICTALKLFSRVLLPWCEAALRQGVYEELKVGEVHSIVCEAQSKVEELVVRLEGKKEEPTTQTTTNGVATLDKAEPEVSAAAPSAPVESLSLEEV